MPVKVPYTRPVKKLFKLIGQVLSILAVAAIGYVGWTFIHAEGRVGALCKQMTPGLSMDALRAFAKANDLGPQAVHTGTNYLMDGKSFGRFGCKVEVDSAGVVSSEFSKSD